MGIEWRCQAGGLKLSLGHGSHMAVKSACPGHCAS